MSDAEIEDESFYRYVRQEELKKLEPGDILVFFYPNAVVEEVEIKSMNFKTKHIIGNERIGRSYKRRKIDFEKFIKYGSLMRKKDEKE